MNRFRRSYPEPDERRATPALSEGEMPPVGGCDMILGIAYVLPQPFGNLYDYGQGWERGTIFADLDKPYEGGCRA